MTKEEAARSRTTDEQSTTQFVDPEEFILQIMSRRRLFRCDDDGSNVRGLLDPATGRRIFVDNDRLLTSR